jgi:clan AA aspartic protease
MIVGMLRRREPLIRLALRGWRGRQHEIEAVVDTGYTGWLTLPPELIGSLQLSWRSFGRGTVADGSTRRFDVYQGKVLWDGRMRSVYVDEFDATALVGMALLQGFELRLQVHARGTVTIKRVARK